MMAATTSAKEGNEVLLVEKNQSLGEKIKITGKGRCNLTFEGDFEKFKENVVKNDRFLYSSFHQFSNRDVMEYFHSLGVKTKVERGGRVFPISDNAMDIVNALKSELIKYKVSILYHNTLKDLIVDEAKILHGVVLNSGKTIQCDKCIIAVGGKSYPITGSTGDGYPIAQKYGHTIVDIKPALVPLKSDDKICSLLQGLSLRNVSLRLVEKNGKKIYENFGEMLFSHFGITGPIVLSASSKLNRVENVDNKLKNREIMACIDLKPALEKDALDKRLCRDFEKYSNKEFKNSLNDLLPQKLIPVVISLSKINADKKVHQITKEERKKLLEMIKDLKVTITGFMPMNMAIVTSGGIDVKQVNPKTMESKMVKGLFFAGEILDVDAYTGGYNLQIAFSTGVAAGKNNEKGGAYGRKSIY